MILGLLDYAVLRSMEISMFNHHRRCRLNILGVLLLLVSSLIITFYSYYWALSILKRQLSTKRSYYTGLSLIRSSTIKTSIKKSDENFDYVDYFFNRTDMCIYYRPHEKSSNIKTNWIRKCAMTIVPIGRLGNLMGEYATLLSLASLNGRPSFIKQRMAVELGTYFKITLPVLDPQFDQSTNWTSLWLDDWMSTNYTNFSALYIQLNGYPCSWTFYHHMRDRILREFQFHDKWKALAQQRLQGIRGNRTLPLTYVGIHVRRGDYRHLMKRYYHGALANPTFFELATDYFRKKYSNVVFVVASDDMNWCIRHINNNAGDVYFVGGDKQLKPGVDMALLTSCNHSIITIGTFGFWIAYLTGGETIYLSNYTWPDSEFLKVFKYKAFYLPNWIPIPANLTHWD
ncbi:fucosyltransferase 1 (galactoside 2-alpha-L-fucosyltransferase, H blood group) [Chamberlinius hualienensis]